MSENPFQPPMADSAEPVVGIKSGDRADLKQLAGYQKAVIACIGIYVLLVISQFAVPRELRLLLAVPGLLVSIAGAVFVFMMAIKSYSTGVGVLLGILTLIPCVGLIVLLIINAKATGIMKQNGIKVGLFGANLSKDLGLGVLYATIVRPYGGARLGDLAWKNTVPQLAILEFSVIDAKIKIANGT